MKTTPWAAAFLLAAVLTACKSGGESDATLTKVGDAAPDFSVQTLDGKPFRLSAMKGRAVVVNFFATWCPACKEEMPHLEKEVWQRFKSNPGFTLISIAREQQPGELTEFRQSESITLPMAADPDRQIFDRYATKFIPRTYLIGPDGRILDQLLGFDQTEFDRLVKTLEGTLAGPGAPQPPKP